MDPQLFKILDKYSESYQGQYCLAITDMYGRATIYHSKMDSVVSAARTVLTDADVFPPTSNDMPKASSGREAVDQRHSVLPRTPHYARPILSIPQYGNSSHGALNHRLGVYSTSWVTDGTRTQRFAPPSTIAFLATPPREKPQLEAVSSPPQKKLKITKSVKPAPDTPVKDPISTERLMVILEKLFLRLNQLISRDLAKEWIKVREPGKKANYPYAGGEFTKPPWWPAGVQHVGPHHMPRGERATLLAFLMVDMRHKKPELERCILVSDHNRHKELFDEMFELIERAFSTPKVEEEPAIDPSLL